MVAVAEAGEAEGGGLGAAHVKEGGRQAGRRHRCEGRPGGNCKKIGLPRKLILRLFFMRIGLPEDLFSY